MPAPQQQTIAQQIQTNWQKVQNLPESKAAVDKLDKGQFNDNVLKCREHLTTFYNFLNYKKSLQNIKAQQLTLDPTTETTFVTRFQGAIDAYQSFVQSATNVSQVFVKSGFDKVFNANAKQLLWHLHHNPHYPQLTNLVMNIGVSESDISYYSASLKANNWDLFGIHGGDGTFSGLVDLASKQTTTLQNMLAATKANGLAAIEGSNNVPTWGWVGVGIVVAGGVACVYFGVCVLIVGVVG